MAVNKRLLQGAAAAGELVPSEHFGVVLYEGDGASSHSINGGKFGAAFYGNGSSSKIDIGNLNLGGDAERTISAWINTNSLSSTQTIFQYGANSNGARFGFSIDTSGKPFIEYYNRDVTTSSSHISVNTWYHLVVTYNGNAIETATNTQIYVNGSAVSMTTSGAQTGSANTTNSNYGIGYDRLNTRQYFSGKLDQVRIFQKALTSSEVSTLYAETDVESLDPLSEDTTDTLQVLGDSSCIATYRFENNEDDESGNYDGSGTEIQYAAGRYGQAASFNNTSGSKMVIGAMNSVIPNNTTGVSFSFWVYLDSVNTGADYDHWFVGQEDYGGAFSDGEFSVRLYEGKVYTDYAQSSSIYRQRKATTVLSTGQWYHIVATYDTSNANITEVYLNGSLQTSSNITSGGTFTTTALMQSSSNMSVGGGPTGTDGKIDQFRIFTKVLSASEVTTLYNENSLVASYRFEGNANDDMRNFDGTASNVTYEYGLNGFTPDLVWLQWRNTGSARNPVMYDSTRGVGKYLRVNTSESEGTNANGLTSFDTGGFTLGNWVGNNENGSNWVAWCLKANGGTTTSVTGTNISSATQQVNTNIDFSITQFTEGSSGTSAVPHGLSGTPDMYIVKRTGGAQDWYVWHNGLSAGNAYIILNSTAAQGTNNNMWTQVDSTNINLGPWNTEGGGTKIIYAFKNVNGFSKFGSYTGNGSADGPIIETGFEPAFLMVKRTSNTADWIVLDNKRNITNPKDKYLFANSNAAEGTSTRANFLSNGFQVITTGANMNFNGDNYIYMAIAADPDTEAPTVAKSFSTVTYTGTGSSGNSVTGLGFEPSLLWLKSRSGAVGDFSHTLMDTVRGASKSLNSNNTNTETTNANGLESFDTDGFTVGSAAGGWNYSGSNYVGWAWKADDNEPTIIGGPATLVYKFEDNANDVTGDYNGSANNISYVTGKFNKAAEFNGSSSYIDTNFTLPAISSYSISFWFNTSSTDTWNDFLADNESSGSGLSSRIILAIKNGTHFHVAISNGSSFWQDNTSVGASDYVDGEWHHYAVAVNGTSVKLFVDGSLLHTYTSSVSAGTGGARSITLGRLGDYNGEYFTGKLDQFRFYSGTFEQDNVSNLYSETIGDNDDLDYGSPFTSIISANANAGFSIVKWEGNGAQKQIPHGLSAVPEMIISKRLDSTNNWSVYHKDLDLSHTTYPNWLYLNLTSAEQNSSSSANHPYYARPSATVIYQNTSTSESTNVDGGEYISYCFHSVSGFSKFGSYAGNGTTQTINVGFQPDFVMIKAYTNSSTYTSWTIIDSVRYGSSSDTNPIYANLSAAEGTRGNGSGDGDVLEISFTSTGFKLGDTGSNNASDEMNDANNDYIYAAFKIN